MPKEPDHTAARTALWRALHLQADGFPPIFDDSVGLRLLQPEKGWTERPDMKYTKRLRASVVARARFTEDVVLEQFSHGLTQYVILGAGLDTFAQRYENIVQQLHVFEIDKPETFEWKTRRLVESGYKLPENLHFVAVDFENNSWWNALLAAGFDKSKPAVFSCSGLTLYLTDEANTDLLKQLSNLATGSVLIISFYLPMKMLADEDQAMQAMAEKGAAASGTPMLSFYTESELLQLSAATGFKNAKLINTEEIEDRYFQNREDGLRPATGELFLMLNL